MNRNPYIPTLWFGVMLTLMTIVLAIVGPGVGNECLPHVTPSGQTTIMCCETVHGDSSCQTFPLELRSPILAIEFASSGQELENLLGNQAACRRDDYRTHTYLDFIFMVIYTTFLILVLLTTAKAYRRDVFILIVLFPLIAFVGDLLENLKILEVLNLIDAQAPLTALDEAASMLNIYVWLKWLALGAVGFFSGIYFFRGNSLHKLMGGLLLLPAIFGVAALFLRGFVFWFVLSVMVTFVLFFLFAALYRGHHGRRRTYF